MKKHLLFLILCLMGILTSCSQKHTRYYIGVSQCSDDEWRHKMYKPQNKMFRFYKTFCSKITLVNTIQNVILNPI